jgi:peptidyl-prolyl cis-trans isomerase SurA
VIKIKKIFFIILLLLQPYVKANSEITDAIFMTIGNKAITQSDVVNEIKIILILNNESYSESNRAQLQELAVSSIIKRSIKLIEIEKNNFFQFSKMDLEKELNRLARKINVDLDTLKNICTSNELNFTLIEDQIKIELFWNSLIFELYKNRLQISQEEIEERLKIKQKEKMEREFLVSEILIDNLEENLLEIEIKKIKEKISVEGFENVAKAISNSESASRGGDLGWLNENKFLKEIKSAVVNTPVGNITKPVKLNEGIILLKVRDVREIKSTLTLEEVKNQLINSEKSKILNMHSLSHYDKLRRTISVKLFND